MLFSLFFSAAVAIAPFPAVRASGYAVTTVPCPANFSSLIRSSGANQTLNPEESIYIAGRRAVADVAFATYIKQFGSTVFAGNASQLSPVIGFASSGGGDRAALYGASVLAALDSRNSSAVSQGTGGLLQSVAYISALSGGSWMLSSLVMHNLPQIYDMVLGANDSSGGWNLAMDLFNPTLNGTIEANFVSSIMHDLAVKASGGYNVTMNDYWARALSRHFLPGTTTANFFDNVTSDHGASLSFASARNLSSWTSHLLPFPIIVIDSYSIGNASKLKPLSGDTVSLSNVVYESSPLELGSYDTELGSFIPAELVGSSPASPASAKARCVNDYGGIGFMMGASSDLFNAYNVSQSIAWTFPLSPIYVIKEAVNSTFFARQPDQQIDIAAIPNPFFGVNNGTYEDSMQTQLRLLDGGLDGENAPLAPLLVRSRGIQVIIVADASSDVHVQPDGRSLYATAERTLSESFASFPPLPGNRSTFVALGLNQRPSFFGCNGNSSNTSYPMIVYLPNYDPTGVTNVSTTTLVYSNVAASRFLDVGFNLTTRPMDTNWSTCLACAVVERARQSIGANQTTACAGCFAEYCYSATNATAVGIMTNGTSPAGSSGAQSGAVSRWSHSLGWIGGAIVAGVGLIFV